MLPPMQQLVLNKLGGSARSIRRELRGLAKAGVAADKALSSLEVLLGDLDSLAGATPTTPKPTTPTRPATSTIVSAAPIVEKPAPKSTCSDATTPPADPPLTARTLETVLQTALLPVYARLDTLEASRAAVAVLPPTPPSSPPQPADDDNEAANASFAEVLARPAPTPAWPRPAPTPARPALVAAEPKTPASHLVHLYAQPSLTVLNVRQSLGIPATVPTRQTKRGDVLIHVPTAVAASCLRLAALEAGFAPATPLALFAAVVHGLPMPEEAEDRLVEAVEGRVGEVGVVRSVRRLPARRTGAAVGSAIVVDEGDGRTAEKGVGSARAALAGVRSMEKGPAGGQEPKKRTTSEEKKTKDEPVRANLAKSGGGSLATSAALDGKTCNASITTTSTSSTPANPFEPVLPPELSDFSIERSGDDDFGAVLEENADSAGAKGQQVSPPPSEYAAPKLHAPAKSDGVESRVSEEPSPFAESENAPFSPSLRAPSTELYRTNATPSTGVSAPSTSDMHLVAESPISPTLAARRQDPPAPSFLESEATSGIWSHVPTPLNDRPTQYRPMPIIDFESTMSEADRSWADETEEAFPVSRTEAKKEKTEKGNEGEGEEKWKKVEKSRKEKKASTRATTTAQGERAGKAGAKGKVMSRARRVAVPAAKEENHHLQSEPLPR